MPESRRTTVPSQVVLTHLDDLQAEMEAGARTLDTVAARARRIREGLAERQLKQAAAAGALMRKITELQRCVAEQRERLAELRRVVRPVRDERLQ
jgi:hypothetical protein